MESTGQNPGGLKELRGLEAPGVSWKVPGAWAESCFQSSLYVWGVTVIVTGRTGLGRRSWSVLAGGKEQGAESQGLVFDRHLDTEITMTVKLVLDNDRELDDETVREQGGVTRLVAKDNCSEKE